MTNIERLEQIVKKELVKEIVPFLQTLDPKERKALAKELTRFKYYWEFTNEQTKSLSPFVSTSYSYKPNGTDDQKRILTLASFFCDDLKTFRKEWGRIRFMDKKTLDELLPVFCPDWFDDFINHIDKNEWTGQQLVYHELMDLEQKGYCTLRPELVVRRLPNAIYRHESRTWDFTPEVLTKWPQTLSTHLWYLFEYDSNIHWADNYMNYTNEGQGNSWKMALKMHADAGAIDRNKLLKESLLATNRNFNKTLSAFFADLFTSLEPAPDELVVLQDELLAVLGSPHSKVVNTSLGYLKQLCKHDKFDHTAFIDQAAMLLSSETKAVVASVLTVFDTIGRTKKETAGKISRTACQAFYQRDNELQLRAAKIVLKYSKGFEDVIREKLQPYRDNVLNETKAVLVGLIDATTPAQPAEEQVISAAGAGIKEIPAIIRFDDLLFLASQAFDNNAPHNFELLPASLIGLQHEITNDNVSKLEPVLQRAYKTIMSDWNSQMGNLDHLLATFFIEYADILCRRFPDGASSLNAIHREFRAKDAEDKAKFSWYRSRIIPLAAWATHSRSRVYVLFRELLVFALNKLKTNDNTPLVSTPTHEHGWLDPVKLIDRLRIYQHKQLPVHEIDLQIALARVDLTKTNALMSLNELNGELRELMHFLLDKDQQPKGPFTNERCWFTAGITRSPEFEFSEFAHFKCNVINRNYFTGRFDWSIIVENFQNSKFDFEKRKNVNFPDTRVVLKMVKPPRLKEEPKKRSWLSFLKKKTEPPLVGLSVYADQQLLNDYATAENDIARLLSMIPNNPAPLLSSVMEQTFRYADFSGTTTKRLVIKTLQALAQSRNITSPVACDFLGISMICGDSEARKIAGEIWIAGVTGGLIDNIRVGTAIGKMNHHEFAPLKRFTDLAAGLYQVSAQHRNAMQQLVTECIKQMPDAPVRNIKSLLRLFRETRDNEFALSHDPAIAKKFDLWKQNKTLQPLIEKMETV